MNTGDKLVIAVTLIGLGFMLGFDVGRIPKQCPEVQGQIVSETWMRTDRSLTCVYVRHTQGLAKTLKII